MVVGAFGKKVTIRVVLFISDCCVLNENNSVPVVNDKAHLLEGAQKKNKDIAILVVCNSRHHSKNLIGLAERLAILNHQIKIVALCEPGDTNYYSRIVDKTKTKLFSIDYAKELDKSSLPDTEDSGGYDRIRSKSKLSERFFSVALWIDNYLSRKSNISRFIGNVVRESSLICYLREKKAKAFYETRRCLVTRIFEDLRPDVVFSFGDRHIDIELPVLLVARSLGVKVVVPYGTYSGVSGLLKVRQIQGCPKRWFPVSLYRLYAGVKLKNQIYKGYFYQHPSVTFALKTLGGLSKNPWCIGNGLSDIVCVDNEHTSERYQNEHVPHEKIHIVGDIAYDGLYKTYEHRVQKRKEIVKDYSLNPNKKIVIIALPQFAEQELMGWDEHWCEIRYLLEQISKFGLNLLISLHPRVNVEDYLFLENEFPVDILRQALSESLPVADLFVAANSSTVFWAVLCGIPVVVANYYGLDSSLFNHLKSIRYVNERADLYSLFESSISRDDVVFDEDWQSLSREKVFDGNVTQRYGELVSGIYE